MATDFRNWAARQHAPFTMFLVASLIGFAILGALTQGAAIQALALTDPGRAPWGFVTYPWAYSPLGSPMGLIALVFLVVWLVQFGGSVERDATTSRFGSFWLVFTLLPALVAALFRMPLAGPWLPLAAVVVAWGARNRTASILLYGLIPLSGTLVAGLVALGVLLSYGAASPVFGLLMALPLALAWAFGGDKLPLPFSGATGQRRRMTVVRGGTKYDDAYFENVKDREMEREERERLRKLFEGK